MTNAVTKVALLGIMIQMLNLKITHKDNKTLARRGELKLFHGTVQTPAFMPVGTIGAVKTLLPREVKELGADIILGNTYHLYLRPGHKEIAKYGGIQAWNKWDGPVLTDSGGFQVFSLGLRPDMNIAAADVPLQNNKPTYDADEAKAGFVKITEDGASFTSHLDGSKHFFTPENVIDIQLALSSDIMMVLDECTEYPATYERAKASMERTHRWAKRAIGYFEALKKENPEVGLPAEALAKVGEKHNLFGIAQGSAFKDLRQQSVEYISSMPFDGVAVGGVSVGEGKDHMYEVMDWTGKLLPEKKPHYLMGIGEPEDLIQAVTHGYDMFDCVLPTRLGRYGVIWRSYRDRKYNYAKFEKWDLRANRFRNDQLVIDEKCGCPTCSQGFSRGFIGHMLREREVVGIRLTTVHNLWTILDLMKEIRQSLENGTFYSQFHRFLK